MKLIDLLVKVFKKIGLTDSVVNYICGNEALPQPLDAETEQQYIRQSISGDGAARDKLVEHNLRLVVYLAKKFWAQF